MGTGDGDSDTRSDRTARRGSSGSSYPGPAPPGLSVCFVGASALAFYEGLTENPSPARGETGLPALPTKAALAKLSKAFKSPLVRDKPSLAELGPGVLAASAAQAAKQACGSGLHPSGPGSPRTRQSRGQAPIVMSPRRRQRREVGKQTAPYGHRGCR